jgi:hypothetical protein
VIAGGGDLICTDGAFLERFVAVVLEHQVGGAARKISISGITGRKLQACGR